MVDLALVHIAEAILHPCSVLALFWNQMVVTTWREVKLTVVLEGGVEMGSIFHML